jgi:hypothetical protein
MQPKRPKRNVIFFPAKVGKFRDIRIKRTKQAALTQEHIARQQAMHKELDSLLTELDSAEKRIDAVWDKSKDFGRDLPKRPKNPKK